MSQQQQQQKGVVAKDATASQIGVASLQTNDGVGKGITRGKPTTPELCTASITANAGEEHQQQHQQQQQHRRGLAYAFDAVSSPRQTDSKQPPRRKSPPRPDPIPEWSRDSPVDAGVGGAAAAAASSAEQPQENRHHRDEPDDDDHQQQPPQTLIYFLWMQFIALCTHFLEGEYFNPTQFFVRCDANSPTGWSGLQHDVDRALYQGYSMLVAELNNRGLWRLIPNSNHARSLLLSDPAGDLFQRGGHHGLASEATVFVPYTKAYDGSAELQRLIVSDVNSRVNAADCFKWLCILNAHGWTTAQQVMQLCRNILSVAPLAICIAPRRYKQDDKQPEPRGDISICLTNEDAEHVVARWNDAVLQDDFGWRVARNATTSKDFLRAYTRAISTNHPYHKRFPHNPAYFATWRVQSLPYKTLGFVVDDRVQVRAAQ